MKLNKHALVEKASSFLCYLTEICRISSLFLLKGVKNIWNRIKIRSGHLFGKRDDQISSLENNFITNIYTKTTKS